MIINKLKFNEIIRLFGVGKKTKDSLVKRNLAPSKVLSGFDNIGDMGVNVKNLRDLRLADIAIPKSDITAISEKTSKNKLANIFSETTFTRIPVYNDTLDNPIGLVHFKDFALRHGFGGAKTFSIKKILRPLIYAPPSMRLDKLMQKMQNERIFMALVIDEYGGVDGMVTIEDLLEQIVGEIFDEHDEEEALQCIEQKPGVFLVDSRLELQDFLSQTGFNLLHGETSDEYDTIGGLVFHLIDRIPIRGEIVHDKNGNEYTVVEADLRRIKKLRVALKMQIKKA